MATPVIETKIKLDGEAEYKQALAQINAGLKNLDANLDLVSAQFRDNEQSVEAMTAQNEILNRSILTQMERIATLRGAIDNSVDMYGEADRRTINWQTSLLKAERQLLEMERALEKNTEELRAAGVEADNFSGGLEDLQRRVPSVANTMDDAARETDDLGEGLRSASDETDGLGGLIQDLAGKLGIDLPDGVTQALGSLNALPAGLLSVVGPATAVATAVVNVEKKLIDMTLQAAASVKQLTDLSQTVGMSTEAAQEWDYVLKSVGSSLEDAQGDLSAFQEKIMEATEGENEAAEMFAKLGVSVTDASGALRGTEDVLNDVVAALSEMENQTERNAVSSILLGGTGEKLIPIYNQGADAIKQMTEEAREMGYVLSNESLDALLQVDQAMRRYTINTEAGANAISTKFSPALADFISDYGETFNSLEQNLADSGLISLLGSLLEVIRALSPALEIISNLLDIKVGPGLKAATVSVSLLSDALRGLLLLGQTVTSVLSEITNTPLLGVLAGRDSYDFSGAKSSWSELIDLFSERGNDATQNALDSLKISTTSRPGVSLSGSRGFLTMYHATGADWFPGGATSLSENGPEVAVLPEGTRIYTAQESRQLNGGGGGDVYNITINARDIQEFNDIVRLAQNARRMQRMGVK